MVEGSTPPSYRCTDGCTNNHEDHVPSVGQQNIDIRASNAINVMIVPAYVMGDAEGTAEYRSMAINTVHTCMRTIAVLRSNLLIMTASDN